MKTNKFFFLILASLGFLNGNAQKKNDRPNILFVILDDAGLDMSAYRSTYVNTPAFDAVARQGVLFNKAYTPNAKCAPSRASIITGRNSWQLEAAANHYIYFPTIFKTYQETLKDNGYYTGFIGKGWSPGIALKQDGSLRDLMGKSYDKHKLNPPTTKINKNDYSTNFEEFIQSVPKGQPWSCWVGLREPHRPYEYKSGSRLGGKNPDMIKKVPSFWPDSLTIREDMLDYAYEIEYADNHVAKILETLKRQGQKSNTLVIFTSDHGMPFPGVKGDQYEQSNHVPMAIMWPDKIKKMDRKVDDYISFIDLAPTILEAAGVPWKESGMHPSPGKSLMPILTSGKSGIIETDRNFVLVGKERHDPGRPHDWGYPIRGIYKDNVLFVKNYEPSRWPAGNPETGYMNVDASPTKTLILNLRRSGVDKHYWMLNFGKRPSEELYDLSKDPYCMDNLAHDPKYVLLKAEMKTEMESKLLEQNDLRMIGFGSIYEKYPLSGKKGFYEDFMNGKKEKTWVLPSDLEQYYIDDSGNNLQKVNINVD